MIGFAFTISFSCNFALISTNAFPFMGVNSSRESRMVWVRFSLIMSIFSPALIFASVEAFSITLRRLRLEDSILSTNSSFGLSSFIRLVNPKMFPAALRRSCVITSSNISFILLVSASCSESSRYFASDLRICSSASFLLVISKIAP